MKPFQKTTKTNDYQLRQTLKKVTGEAEVMNERGLPSIVEVLNYLCCMDRLRLPFRLEDIFLAYERQPVFGSLHLPRSPFIQLLMDRQDQVCLTSDSILSGREAVCFATLVPDADAVVEWLRCMNEEPELTLKPVGDGLKVIVAPLAAFVWK